MSAVKNEIMFDKNEVLELKNIEFAKNVEIYFEVKSFIRRYRGVN